MKEKNYQNYEESVRVYALNVEQSDQKELDALYFSRRYDDKGRLTRRQQGHWQSLEVKTRKVK